MSSLWWSRRAIVLHVTLALAVPSFLLMGFWQLHRAMSGNTLSWAYTVEWPFFAAYATWMWWKLLHDAGDPVAAAEGSLEATEATEASTAVHAVADGGSTHGAAGSTSTSTSGAVAAPTPEGSYDPYDERDPELAAYNRYLAELNASGKPKRW